MTGVQLSRCTFACLLRVAFERWPSFFIYLPDKNAHDLSIGDILIHIVLYNDLVRPVFFF